MGLTVSDWTGIVGVVLAVLGIGTSLFPEETREIFVGLLGHVRAKQGRVSGRWIAICRLPKSSNPPQITQTLIVKQLGKSVIVRVSDDKQTIRARGKLLDNRYFTGTWYHAKQKSLYHGAFQLLLHPEGDRLDGKWVGFNPDGINMQAGDWTWTRMQ